MSEHLQAIAPGNMMAVRMAERRAIPMAGGPGSGRHPEGGEKEPEKKNKYKKEPKKLSDSEISSLEKEVDDKIQWAKDTIKEGKDHEQKGLSDLYDRDDKIGQMTARVNEGKVIPNSIHVDGELGELNGRMQKLLQSTHDQRLLPAFQKLHEFRTQEMPGLIANKEDKK